MKLRARCSKNCIVFHESSYTTRKSQRRANRSQFVLALFRWSGLPECLDSESVGEPILHPSIGRFVAVLLATAFASCCIVAFLIPWLEISTAVLEANLRDLTLNEMLHGTVNRPTG